MQTAALFELATRFRKGIEAVSANQRPIGLQSFPHGACGDASLLLGAWLVDHGVSGFMYICGERGCRENNTWTSHAWLQRGTCVVDITADQFTDAPSSVVVADPSPWHHSFETERPIESDFRRWSGYGADLLRPMYERMQRQLADAAHHSDG